jgi:regulatory protein
MKKTKAGKATAYAYRLFSIRMRSERELKDRLFKKGYGSAAVYEVTRLLKEKNIVDDSKFARLWIESRMRTNPRGDMALRKELRMKGVDGAIIDKVLSEKEGNEESIAMALAKQKVESLKNLPEDKAKKKMFDFLARKGFKFEVIEDVIKEYAK